MKLLGLKPIYWFLVVAFCVHFFVAALPQNNRVWDENYYTFSAVDTIHGVASNIEHPPLVKLIVGVSVLVFGDNWVAWRLPIILFSLVVLVLTYLVARRFLSEKLSLFAVGLVSVSTIFLLVGSASILDVPTLAFGLAGLWFVLQEKYGYGGLMFGLSFLCKELAVLMFLPVLVYMIHKHARWFRILWLVGVGFCIAFFGVWIYDVIWRPMAQALVLNPVEHWWLMVVYQLKLNGVVRAASAYPWYPPWSWVSPFGANALNPLKWVWLTVGDRLVYAWKSQPNWVVEYLMFPLLALLPVAYWLKRNVLALLSWLWIGFTFLPWLVAGFFLRTEANFYVVYSAPFLAVGCSYLYMFIRNRRVRWMLAIAQFTIGIICFMYYFPVQVLVLQSFIY